jgi:hypothetical protein
LIWHRVERGSRVRALSFSNPRGTRDQGPVGRKTFHLLRIVTLIQAFSAVIKPQLGAKGDFVRPVAAKYTPH